MTLLSTILLGIIEGLTEFFPVSSTGHIIVAEKILGITSPSLFFNIGIQVGAILAALLYYRKKIFSLIQDAIHKLSAKSTILYYGIATLPALITGFFLHSLISDLQSSVGVVGITTIGIAFFLLWIEKTYKKTAVSNAVHTPSVKDFFVIGVYQAISVIPGVSRSGMTISGALTRNLTFKEATDIAFILAIPVMTIAALYEGTNLLLSGSVLTTDIFLHTVIGGIVAFFVAYATISVTVPLLKKYGFLPFIIYRIILGAGILLFLS